MTDVIFLPSLPAKVIAVNGAKGQQPGQPFLELAARGSLALTGELPPAYAATGQARPEGEDLRRGDRHPRHRDRRRRGHGDDDNAGRSDRERRRRLGCGERRGVCRLRVCRFRVRRSAGSAGTAGSSNSGSAANPGATPFIPLTVQPSKPLPAALNGENVLVTVETGRTEGPVLTVPVAAIVTTGSGTSYVTVAGADGKQTQVPVTPGISENGYVQVTPVRGGKLAAGDSVVVSG